MTGSVTLFAAFGGGLVSFLSPCVLPIVPAYLSIITGLEVGDIEQGRGNLPRIARDTGMFVAGFSAVFILLGLPATAVGSTTRPVNSCTSTTGPSPSPFSVTGWPSSTDSARTGADRARASAGRPPAQAPPLRLPGRPSA